MGEENPTPQDQVRRLYEETEAGTARAMEDLVGRNAFGELLARATENAMALTRIGADLADMAIRNLRLAGRNDVTRLGRQLARTEDKLEMVLQEVERVQERLDADAASPRAKDAGGSARSSSRRSPAAKSRSSNSSVGARRSNAGRRRSAKRSP